MLICSIRSLYHSFKEQISPAIDPNFIRLIALFASRIPVPETDDDPALPLEYYDRNNSKNVFLRLIELLSEMIDDFPEFCDFPCILTRFVNLYMFPALEDRSYDRILKLLTFVLTLDLEIGVVSPLFRIFAGERTPFFSLFSDHDALTIYTSSYLKLATAVCHKGDAFSEAFADSIDSLELLFANLHGRPEYFELLSAVLDSCLAPHCLNFINFGQICEISQIGTEALEGPICDFVGRSLRLVPALVGSAIETGIVGFVIECLNGQFSTALKAIEALFWGLKADANGLARMVVEGGFLEVALDVVGSMDGQDVVPALECLRMLLFAFVAAGDGVGVAIFREAPFVQALEAAGERIGEPGAGYLTSLMAEIEDA
jgi:hypothetical protein